MDALSDLAATFEEAGLSAPPIPAKLVPQLRRMDEWFYTTRNIERMDTYMLKPCICEVLQEAPVDFVVVNHAGHGVNSYSINYVLVCGPLALLLQSLWGGIYMDADRSSASVRSLLADASSLIDVTLGSPLADAGGRLVVVSSYRDMSAWGWTEGPDPTLDVDEWLQGHHSPTPLAEAARWVATQS